MSDTLKLNTARLFTAMCQKQQASSEQWDSIMSTCFDLALTIEKKVEDYEFLRTNDFNYNEDKDRELSQDLQDSLSELKKTQDDRDEENQALWTNRAEIMIDELDLDSEADKDELMEELLELRAITIREMKA